jgi:hypothetical protein
MGLPINLDDLAKAMDECAAEDVAIEFTPEFIAEQKAMAELTSKRPWHACGNGECNCRSIWTDEYPVLTVTHGEWGDDYPAIRMVSELGGLYEAYMEQITYGEVFEETATANAKYITAACNNYPAALEEIEHMQATAKFALSKIVAQLETVDGLDAAFLADIGSLLSNMITSEKPKGGEE